MKKSDFIQFLTTINKEYKSLKTNANMIDCMFGFTFELECIFLIIDNIEIHINNLVQCIESYDKSLCTFYHNELVKLTQKANAKLSNYDPSAHTLF